MNAPPRHIKLGAFKGASLFYALTFTLIIAVTITSIIGLVFLHQEYVRQTKEITQRIDLVQKATLLSEQGLSADEINTLLAQVNPTSDSLIVFEEEWGIYELLRINFYNNQDALIKSDVGLMGFHSDQMSAIGAFVMDEGNPLIVAGTTKLEGTTYLTKTEIKPGSIEGYGYRNKELLFGQKEIHANTQTIETEPLNQIREIWRRTRNVLEGIDGDTLSNGYNNDPIVIRGDTLILSNIVIEGNVIIIANQAVLIGSGVNIQNAIVISPQIFIDTDIPIRVQAFASKRLEVFDGSTLLYPSVLVLDDFEESGRPILDESSGQLELAGNTQFTGVLMANKRADGQPIGKITINENAKVRGYVFSHGPTELRTPMQGSVFTHNFEHISPRGRRYVNYLFDAGIQPEGISNIVLHSAMKDFETEKQILTWLENS